VTRVRGAVGVVGLAGVVVLAVWLPASAQAGFGFSGFSVSPVAEGGAPETAAGAHPYALEMKAVFDLAGEEPDQPGIFTAGDVRGLKIELPRGMIENPDALLKCGSEQFLARRVSPFEQSASGESCPEQSQIGVVTLRTSYGGGQTRTFGVFNLVPPPGVAAAFGFAPYGVPVVFTSQLLPGASGEYTLTLEAQNLYQSLDLYSLEMTVWGVPWAAGHDGERGDCLNEMEPSSSWGDCSLGKASIKPVSYLSLPTYCGVPLLSTAYADSWRGARVSASYEAPALEACETVPFDPQAVGAITDPHASSPTGFEFVVTNNTEGLLGPIVRAPSETKTAVVSLPEGVTINPSLGAGLGVCLPGQYAAETAFSPQGAACPNDSKIGEFTVESPLYEGEIAGAIYLAQSDNNLAGSAPGAENPFNTLFAVYLVAKSPQRGILIKLAGKLVPNPVTGQVTATFEGLPQFPYTNLKIHFREGQHAPLVTPSACGTYYTYTSLTPWLGALGEFHRKAFSTIETGIGGGPCPVGAVPFEPTAVAGTLNSEAGVYSPFYLGLSRTDSEQEITSYSALLPPGMTANLSGVPFCPDAAIEAARHMSGTEEDEHPSCPAASEIGRTSTGYGVGAALAYASGKLYLAGPYHGSSFSVVAIDPAVVGPFDLGVVIVRSALRIDPHTADASIDSAGSDPIPHIIDGIPIHLRDIHIYIDRPHFTLNSTDCEPFSITSTMTGSAAPFTNPEDITASLTSSYQASDCATLAFEPAFAVATSGKTSRRDGASLTAKLTYPADGIGRDANIKSVKVDLPVQLPARLTTLQKACADAQFEANPAGCPAASVVGHARAITPILPVPLEGPAYFVSHGGQEFPELVIVLQGYGVTVYLRGETFIGETGITSSTFATIPDVPVGSFELVLPQGPYSALAAHGYLCPRTITVYKQVHGRTRALHKDVAANLVMPTTFIGQNGAGATQNTKIHITGCTAAKKPNATTKKSRAQKAGHGKAGSSGHGKASGRRKAGR
jgi:hypothetical protein